MIKCWFRLLQFCLLNDKSNFAGYLMSNGWLVGFYGISTIVGYLTSNLFLCKLSFLFKTNQFSMSRQFNCQKHYFKLLKQLYVTIQVSVNTVLMSKNSSISNNSVKQINCQTNFYFKLFSSFKLLYKTIQFRVSTVSMSKTIKFQTIQFSKSTQFNCKYSLILKNISISSYSV